MPLKSDEVLDGRRRAAVGPVRKPDEMRATVAALLLLVCSYQQQGDAMKLPARVIELLPQRALADPKAVAPLWRATRACYPNEDAAIDAIKLNKALLLPWVSSKESIEGSFRVLCETLGSRDEAVKVVTLNPGVLGCDPKRLSLSSADEIKSVAATAAALGSLRGPPLLVAAVALLACLFVSAN